MFHLHTPLSLGFEIGFIMFKLALLRIQGLTTGYVKQLWQATMGAAFLEGAGPCQWRAIGVS